MSFWFESARNYSTTEYIITFKTKGGLDVRFVTLANTRSFINHLFPN